MKAAGEKSGVDINREQSHGDNSNAVLDHEQGKDDEGQDSRRPYRPKEKVAGEQTRDEQGQARPDATAFFGDLDVDARQGEHEPVPENGNAHELEERVRNFRRPALQPEDRLAEEE